LLWTVHPLNTESVSYVIQRAESLMGLFYLLTLYFFSRSLDGRGRLGWSLASVVACLCGMATKEVMVSAPLIVFCYDRAFISGSWREAWAQRRRYYAALAATWLLLAWLVVRAGNRGGTSGLGAGVSPFHYWLTQPAAIIRYLCLCFWPAGQVFDYGTLRAGHLSEILPGTLLLALLVAGTGWALWRAQDGRPGVPGKESETAECAGGSSIPMWGLLGLVFLAILAPTSVVPGNRQTMAEHRMYLALIPVIVATLAIIARLAGRRSRFVVPILAFVLAVPCVGATYVRNKTYESVLNLYASDAERMPDNPFAQANLGTELLNNGRYAEAEHHLREALRLKPSFPTAEDNLGNALAHMGRLSEAESHYEAAIREDPCFADPHNNLAFALLQENRISAAVAEIDAALRLDSELIEARNNLARALVREDRFPEAFAQYRKVLEAAPDRVETHNDFGIALALSGNVSGAVVEYREAIRRRPGYSEAHYNLADALSGLGRFTEAIVEYREVLRLCPTNPSAHNNLGNALLNQGLAPEAVTEFEAALGIDPSHALTHYNLANALLRLGRRGEAVVQFRETLRLEPDFAPASRMLEQLRVQP